MQQQYSKAAWGSLYIAKMALQEEKALVQDCTFFFF